MSNLLIENNNGDENEVQSGVMSTGSFEDLSKEQELELINQIAGEYQYSWTYNKPRWDVWNDRLEIYNYQRRDDEAIGVNLMYTQHQTTLASLYSDQQQVVFSAREQGDETQADNLNNVAEYDAEEMGLNKIWYDLLWDATFFGHGLVRLMEWRSTDNFLAPMPDVWSPAITLTDPDATSVNGDSNGNGASRFIGKSSYLTRYEINHINDQSIDGDVYKNTELISPASFDGTDPIDSNARARKSGEGYSTTRQQLTGENETVKLIEWFTHFNGKKVFVTLANDGNLIVRYKVLDTDYFPLVDMHMNPVPDSWAGVSVIDLTEDKQRMSAVIMNLGVTEAKIGVHPMYAFNKLKISNYADLNREYDKWVPVDGDPAGAIQEVPHSAVKPEVYEMLDRMELMSQKATATPDIAQGIFSKGETTATEVDTIETSLDNRYGLMIKVTGWAYQEFWKQWYQMYKNNMSSQIDEKVVRISGAFGQKWRTFTKDQIVLNTDPDITVESRVVEQAKRRNELQGLLNMLQVGADSGMMDKRYVLKRVGKLSSMTDGDLIRAFPAIPQELAAQIENEALDEDKRVEVSVTDNDQAHMIEHAKAKDSKASRAHFAAHKANILFKAQDEELMALQGNNILTDGTQEQANTEQPGRGAASAARPLGSAPQAKLTA